jgi:hypothetical protein
MQLKRRIERAEMKDFRLLQCKLDLHASGILMQHSLVVTD